MYLVRSLQLQSGQGPQVQWPEPTRAAQSTMCGHSPTSPSAPCGLLCGNVLHECFRMLASLAQWAVLCCARLPHLLGWEHAPEASGRKGSSETAVQPGLLFRQVGAWGTHMACGLPVGQACFRLMLMIIIIFNMYYLESNVTA